ncbi:hypothetical protein MKW94_010264 [Papaver nudicaule]|uniref:Transposase MuDR plant domain-containing protein n=1 Tax=Papaver nudicaule TaxID=74823 RepID=A0AA41S501_PAPNU|nr:hypothetical protein [Papaver nudicaule]
MDKLRYYPTKGGLVVGKSKRVEHPNLVKMPDYRPEEDLDFLPILQPQQTSTKGIQDETSSVGSQASTVIDALQSDADCFDLTYTSAGSINEAVIPDEDQDSEDEGPLLEPEIDDDADINITGQIQATLASTLEFNEFVENTQNIGGDHELSENQEFVEKLFIGQQWLSKVQCRDYLKDLALDMNYCMSYKCKDETCQWFVYCSTLSDGQTFECKKGNFVHTCESYHGLKHPLANARWVAKVMLECYKAHPNYKPRDLWLRALTFISDRQKGLIEGVSSNFGDVNHQHRYCFRHLYKNFKKSHPGKNIEFIAWRAARSFSEVGHQIWMDRLKEAKESAPGWFDREAAETWSRCYFDRSSKCEHVTSNFCEAFNSWILDLRRLPIRTSG